MFLWFFKFFVLDYFLDFSFFSFDLYFLNLIFFYLHLFLFYFLLFFCSDYLDLHRPILLLLLYPFWTSFTSFYSLVSMTWTTSSTHLLCHLFYVHFWLQHFLDRHQQFSWTWTVWYDVQQKQSVNLGNRCSCSDSYIALSCIFSLFSVRETSS